LLKTKECRYFPVSLLKFVERAVFVENFLPFDVGLNRMKHECTYWLSSMFTTEQLFFPADDDDDDGDACALSLTPIFLWTNAKRPPAFAISFP